jgi:hypothetical protein
MTLRFHFNAFAVDTQAKRAVMPVTWEPDSALVRTDDGRARSERSYRTLAAGAVNRVPGKFIEVLGKKYDKSWLNEIH